MVSETYLSNFHIIDPPFTMSQEKGLEWLLKAHIAAESKKQNLEDPVLLQQFKQEMEESIEKVCCKPSSISTRRYAIEDFHQKTREEMSLYSLTSSPNGEGMGKRTQLFREIVDKVFENFYPATHLSAPDDLIHVTCTGYTAPSGAQTIVSKRKWGKKTRVIHAYHMGCLAALPAIRIGVGLRSHVDVVHTELSTLHLNPALHSKEQLVGQSLFADGFIKYTLSPHKSESPEWKICALHEELIEGTESAMGWVCEDWGMQLTLSKDIPKLIHAALPAFMEILLKKGEKSKKDMAQMLFAIHPGGPKIIDLIQRQLDLTPAQVVETKEILFNRGNISSATLPHIWEKMLTNNNYPKGTFVVSLAFGPGLCIHGAILKKV